MVSVNSGVSTLWVPSTVTAMKVMHWRMIIVNVEVKRIIIPCMHVLPHDVTDTLRFFVSLYTIPSITTTDIPECTAGLHNCTGNAICVEAVGYFRCACPANYRIDENTYASCKGIALLYISVCVEIVQGNKYVIYDAYISDVTTKYMHKRCGWGVREG